VSGARSADSWPRGAASLRAIALTAAAAAAVTLVAVPDAVAQDTAVVPTDQAAILEAADAGRSRGDEDASIRIVEVSDFECPFCAQFYNESYRTIDSLYVKSGIARYLWISFPNSRHPRAWPAIEAAFCASAAGRFWEMHDLLFENQEEWMEADDAHALFLEYGGRVGVEAESFEACLVNDRTSPLQVSDYDAALRSGITSTPFFVLGDSVAIRGVVSADRFRVAMDSLLDARGLRKP
jgi:protein-disulfide isomerase